jgi:hypothetical protein
MLIEIYKKKRAVWSFLSSFLCDHYPFWIKFCCVPVIGCLKFHITSGLDQLAEKDFGHISVFVPLLQVELSSFLTTSDLSAMLAAR